VRGSVEALPDEVDFGDVVLDRDAERQRVLVDDSTSHVEQLTWDTCRHMSPTHSFVTAADNDMTMMFINERYAECTLEAPAKIVRGEKFEVKFSTCPLNAPIRGCGWVHPNILSLIFSTLSNVVSTSTKRWLATALDTPSVCTRTVVLL